MFSKTEINESVQEEQEEFRDGSVLAAAGNHLHETIATVAADDDHITVLIHLHLA